GFQEILEMEKRAKYFYDHYIDQIDDEEIRLKLTEIRRDEIEHIEIAEKLIDCVK
ncbi:MAG: hypothetical protein ISS33_07150, partial [Candidatus Omnitrophica bacterium]|nr:hypothetical protein [Candidatus Omnitrophota bacterium]